MTPLPESTSFRRVKTGESPVPRLCPCYQFGQQPRVELPSHVSDLAREALEVEKQGRKSGRKAELTIGSVELICLKLLSNFEKSLLERGQLR